MRNYPVWFYWGNQPLSFLRYMTLHSACAFNKDVRLIRRREPVSRGSVDWAEKQDTEHYRGLDYTRRLPDLPLTQLWLEELCPGIAALNAPEVHTSDLLSYWLLATSVGCTVADMDIVWVKPVPEVTHPVQLVQFGAYPLPGYRPVSFLQGCSCSFWAQALQTALAKYEPQRYESCGSHCMPSCVPDNMLRCLPSEVVFPWAEKVPWTFYKPLNFEHAEKLPDITAGIHWYAGGAQDWNQRLTADNWRSFDSTITRAIAVTYSG